MNYLSKSFEDLTEWEKFAVVAISRRPFVDCSKNDPQKNHDLIIELSRKNIPPAVCECPPTGILYIDLVGARTRWIYFSNLTSIISELKRADLILSSAYVMEKCKEYGPYNDKLAYEVASRPI